MKIKKYLACLLAAMMMAGTAAACGKTATDSTDSTASTEAATEATTVAETETTTEGATTTAADEDGQEVKTQDVEFEPAIDAGEGQAYLAIVDGQWWIQYWGSSKKDGYMLSYNAGVADIKGDGQYTVSVTADTNGFRYDTTGDVNDQYTPEGLSFMSVMVPNGEKLFPGMVITVDSIKVDGKEIELAAKNYTSSDDGIETRTNLFNGYVDKPSADARTAEGALYDSDGNALDICADYSPQVVNPSDFAKWTTVEVTFTVSGTDGAAADNAGGDTADSAAEGETDAEAETSAEAEVTAEETTAAETTAAE